MIENENYVDMDTGLLWTVRDGDERMAKKLIEAGANVEKLDEDGRKSLKKMLEKKRDTKNPKNWLLPKRKRR